MQEFGTETWSVKVPDGWSFRRDDVCATLEDESNLGALQISGAFKDTAVTDADLTEFASDRIDAGAVAAQAQCGDFEGFAIAVTDGDFHCRQWYLRSGQQALFVTYTCALADRGAHDTLVDEVLSTLTAGGR